MYDIAYILALFESLPAHDQHEILELAAQLAKAVALMDGGLLRWKEFLAFSTQLCYPICGAASTTVQGRRLAPPSRRGLLAPPREG